MVKKSKGFNERAIDVPFTVTRNKCENNFDPGDPDADATPMLAEVREDD